MYRDVDLYAKVRRAVMVENQSERRAAKRFGISRKMVSKMVRRAVPPGYQRKETPVSPKLGPFVGKRSAVPRRQEAGESVMGFGEVAEGHRYYG